MTPKWIIRQAQGSDLNFIYSTWLKSYQADSRIGGSTKKSLFFAEYYSVLDHILSKRETKIIVACLPDEPDVILGYGVTEPGVAHYFFTKKAFRKLGIARSIYLWLFGQEPRGLRGPGNPPPSFTHRTRTAEPIFDKYSQLLYNPFLLFSRLKPIKTE